MHKIPIRYLSPLCLLIFTIFIAGCKESKNPPEPSDKKVDFTQKISPGDEPLAAGPGETLFVMDIQGMTCQGCVDAISTKVAKLPEVHSVRVSLANRTAWVIAGENTLDNAAIAAAIEKAGYTATPATLQAPSQRKVLKKKPAE